MVRWRRVNLMDDLAPLGQFDLILCRNVLGQLDARGAGAGAGTAWPRPWRPAAGWCWAEDEDAGRRPSTPSTADAGVYAAATRPARRGGLSTQQEPRR